MHVAAIHPASTSSIRSTLAWRGGSRIDHATATDCGLGAQHDMVAARLPRRDLRGEAAHTDRRPFTTAANSALVPWWTWMRARRRSAASSLERHVESVAHGKRARRDERVAAPQLRPRPTPGSATATRWPGSARSTAWSCTCTLRTRTSSARRVGVQLVAGSPTRPDHSVPVVTVPMPRSENTRSTYSRVADERSSSSSCAPSASSRPQLVEPRPVLALSATTGAPGTSSRPPPRARARASPRPPRLPSSRRRPHARHRAA